MLLQPWANRGKHRATKRPCVRMPMCVCASGRPLTEQSPCCRRRSGLALLTTAPSPGLDSRRPEQYLCCMARAKRGNGSDVRSNLSGCACLARGGRSTRPRSKSAIGRAAARACACVDGQGFERQTARAAAPPLTRVILFVVGGPGTHLARTPHSPQHIYSGVPRSTVPRLDFGTLAAIRLEISRSRDSHLLDASASRGVPKTR